MRRIKCFGVLLILVFLAYFAGSCQRTSAPQSQGDSSVVTDSALLMDSVDIDSAEFEASVPKRADEFFNDFIYSFTTNRRYQMERIVFPLPYERNGRRSMISRSQWHYDRLHTSEEFYTVFFDRESSLELEKSQAVSQVTIEYIDMISELVKNYFFSRDNDQWMLRKVSEYNIDDYYDRDFILFFERFVSDSLFQQAHLASKIEISMEDSEDEFETMTGTIEAEQWFSFCPELPQEKFYNVNYGQPLDNKRHRVVALEGFSNGFLSLLFFRLHEDKGWILYKLKS